DGRVGWCPSAAAATAGAEDEARRIPRRRASWRAAFLTTEGDPIMAQQIVMRLESGGCAVCGAPPKGGAKPPAPAFPKATDVQNKAFIERIGSLLPRARRWVESAQLKIAMAGDFARKGPVNPNDPFPALHDIGKAELTLFNKYFHSDKQP